MLLSLLHGNRTLHIDQNPPDSVPYNDDSDEDLSEDAFDLRDVSSDVEVEADELESDARYVTPSPASQEHASSPDLYSVFHSRFEEVDDTKSPKSLKRPHDSDAMDTEVISAAKLSNSEKKANKKLKAEDGKAVAAGTEAPANGDGKKDKKSKKQKKTEANSDKNQAKPAAAKNNVVVKEIAGGITIKDCKTGSGPQAKKGNTVSMRYIGKLQNGTVFDKNVKGKPVRHFRFGRIQILISFA